jgi:hypothetical protein
VWREPTAISTPTSTSSTSTTPASTTDASLAPVSEVALSPVSGDLRSPSTVTAPDPVPVKSAVPWIEVAIRDMRAPDGSYAANDDRLLHRSAVSYSVQSDRASLTMGRYGTSAAFTTQNPDYQSQLAYLSPSDPMRYIERWPRLNVWDQVFLGELYGANHAPGYTGNSRVRTWGYELWIKTRAGTWRQVFKTDSRSAEAWRPTFRGSASFDPSALDLRKEADGSTSTRPLPALGLDSSGSYWIPHGYTGGILDVDPDDVKDILVLCYSQLVLHDPNGVDDRQHARFLFGLGVDWYPPKGTTVPYYPGVGTSRHKYATVEPQMHVMHTMTEAEFRANPPPR